MLTGELLQVQDNEEFRQCFGEAFPGLEPDLENMRPVVLRDAEGKIAAFFGLYQVVVADSMWVRKDWRRKGVWRQLVEFVNGLPWGKGRGYYFIEEKAKQGLVAKLMGGEKLPVQLWRKKF